MKRILPVITAVLLLFPSFTFAETKEIISEGTYNMGDGETPTVAESRALLQAKRTAVEEAGTYVESYSKTRNFQLTVDEIQVLASGVMEVEILDKKRTVVGDGFNFWVKIKARVSTDRMEEMAKRVKEKSVVEDYKRIQEAYDKSQKEIEELKRKLAGTMGEKGKKRVEAKIADEERRLQANEWFQKGYLYYLNKEYDKAIEAYSHAVTKDPSQTFGFYYNQGIIHGEKGQYDSAIENYNKAIALKPNLAEIYNNRGLTYMEKSQYKQAIEDFNTAVSLKPNYYIAYRNRGMAYATQGYYDNAIEDLTKAIVLNPNDAEVYYNRGVTYGEKGQLDSEIENYNKAIALDPNLAYAYYNRGLAYNNKGQHDIAIEDFNKVIALDPNYAHAYNDRGVAYVIKGLMGRAISDLQKACDLGSEMGCENLQKALRER